MDINFTENLKKKIPTLLPNILVSRIVPRKKTGCKFSSLI